MPKTKKSMPVVEPQQKPLVMPSVSNQKKIMLVLGLVVLIALLWLFKNPKMFLVAVVNNQPIMTSTLNSNLQKKFGSRVLDQMIDEILIKSESQKQGVSVSKVEVDNQIKTLQEQIGGKDALNQLLTQQGLTVEDLNSQIEMKLLVDKILAKQIVVSDKEIQDFLDKNKDTLPATDSATQKDFAQKSLQQQKLSDAFQKWYDQLKSKAKIYKFL